MADFKSYLNLSLDTFISDLSAKMPAPGGGSASALVSSLGIALLCMVGNYSIGKSADEEKMESMLRKAEQLLEKAKQLIQKDIEAYKKVSDAFKLPKEDKNRKTVLQEALKDAAVVPSEIIRVSFESLGVAKEMVSICNKKLISDVGCGVYFLESAIFGAKLNLDINLKYIEEKDFKERIKLPDFKEVENIVSYVSEKVKEIV